MRHAGQPLQECRRFPRSPSGSIPEFLQVNDSDRRQFAEAMDQFDPAGRRKHPPGPEDEFPMGKLSSPRAKRRAIELLRRTERIGTKNGLELEIEQTLVALSRLLERWGGHRLRSVVTQRLRTIRQQLHRISPFT